MPYQLIGGLVGQFLLYYSKKIQFLLSIAVEITIEYKNCA